MRGSIRHIFDAERKGAPLGERPGATLYRHLGLGWEADPGQQNDPTLTAIDVKVLSDPLWGSAPMPIGELGANLVTEGIDLAELGVGRRVRLGERAVAQVTRMGWGCPETREGCRYPLAELRHRQGVSLRVLVGGPLAVGDDVFTEPALDRVRYAIVTLSDRGAAGDAEDRSGPLIRSLVEEGLDAELVSYRLLPDDEAKLSSHLVSLCDEELVDLILTTGGTGLSPRDRTPEATRKVLDLEIPGIAEAIRLDGLRKTPHAMLSRAVAGLRGQTLIVNLSGSPRAVREQLALVLPVIPHAVQVASGITVSCARA